MVPWMPLIDLGIFAIMKFLIVCVHSLFVWFAAWFAISTWLIICCWMLSLGSQYNPIMNWQNGFVFCVDLIIMNWTIHIRIVDKLDVCMSICVCTSTSTSMSMSMSTDTRIEENETIYCLQAKWCALRFTIIFKMAMAKPTECKPLFNILWLHRV